MAFGMIPFDPFRELDRMERLFRRTLGETPRGGEALVAPAVEVTDQGDHYLVRAEVPGVKEEDVEITLTGNMLSIRGEKRYERTGGRTVEAKSTATAGAGPAEKGTTEKGSTTEKGGRTEKGSKAEQTAGEHGHAGEWKEQKAGESGSRLTTSARGKLAEGEERGELARPLYSEVFYGRFERVLTLPDDIDSEKVEANAENGVFFIQIGKKEEHRARRINIRRH